jgi:hypothetical protein
MYNPSTGMGGTDADLEWVELYNNDSNTINLTDWFIDNKEIDSIDFSGYSYLIVARQLIDDDSDNVSFESFYGNNDGVWNSTDGNFSVIDLSISFKNTGDIVQLNNSNGTLIDLVTYSNNYGNGNNFSIEKINFSNDWAESSIIYGTPGKQNQPNTTTTQQSTTQDLTFKISINKEQLNIGEVLIINGNFTNTYNQSINGSLIIKIGKEKPEGGFEYPEDYILINQEIVLDTNSNTTLNNLFGNVTWTVPSNAFTGRYKVYAPFSSDVQNRRPSELFDVYGIGNIAIDSWDINSYDLNLVNNTLNVSINITNNESFSYQINLTIVVEDLKTVSGGEDDFEFFCEYFNISNNTQSLRTCTFILPNDTITNSTQDFDIYSQISFVYDNTSIVKKSNEKEINITGLDDLGEPVLSIISENISSKFGDFTTVLVKYSANNYNFPLRFIAYAYTPKRMSNDLDGNTIYKKFCEVDTAIELDNFERGETIYFSLPLFIKDNCDNDYNTGTYESFARVCEFKDEWNYMTPTNDYKKSFNLTITGENNANCPVTKYLSSSSEDNSVASGFIGSSSVNNQNIKRFTYDNVKFELNFPDEIGMNKEFFVDVKINNTADVKKVFSIWSYVYKGRTVLMEREENLINITINQGTELSFNLENKITKKDIAIDDYRLMIKIKSTGMKTTKSISNPVDLIFNQRNSNALIMDFSLKDKNGKRIELEATIQSSSDDNLKLILESNLNSQEKDIEIKARKEYTHIFEEEVVEGNNFLFLKLMNNEQIIDIKELIVSLNDNEMKSFSKKDLLFSQLQRFKEVSAITGSVVSEPLNKKTVYISSSAKARELVSFFIVLLLAFLSIKLIWKKT